MAGVARACCRQHSTARRHRHCSFNGQILWLWGVTFGYGVEGIVCPCRRSGSGHDRDVAERTVVQLWGSDWIAGLIYTPGADGQS